MRLLARVILHVLHVNVKYRDETLKALAAGRCIVTCNHVSMLDGLIVALASPIPLVFAVDTEFSRDTFWSRWGLAFVAWLGYGQIIPLDATAPFGLRTLSKGLVAGGNVMVFPEGVISLTGHRGQDQAGLAWLAQRTQATVVALQIEGAQASRFFAKRGTRIWPKIRLIF